MKIKDMHPLEPTNFDPFRNIERMMNFMDFSFGYPKVDVIDENDRIKIVADMPGVEKNDIKVKIERDNVIIRAKMDKETRQEDKNYYREERNYADYFRQIPLPVEVKKDEAKATFRNGILTLEMQKANNDESDIKID